MKIGLVLPEPHAAHALSEMGYFLARSGAEEMELTCWQLPDDTWVEQQLEALVQQYAQTAVDILLFPSGWQGAELATRLAHRLGGEAWNAAYEADFVAGAVRKSVCGGALSAALRLQHKPWCLSVAVAPDAGSWQPDVACLHLPLSASLPDWLVSETFTADEEATGLTQARRVLAVGRGVGSTEAMMQAEVYAEELGMEVGASREAVMHAWCGMERLIGMSGNQIAPEICLVAGVSGAPAFVSGIRRSQFVVAINNDPQAAIFRHADVGIVDDLLPVLAELSACFKADT